MQVKFKNLVLEVTRRCNMQCNHCMRGDAQDTDMDTTVIQRLFEGTREIKHLTLTGGEPSLCPEVIDYIAYYIRQNFCRIGSFFCATNAKEYSEPFVAALNKLYDLCADKKECILSVSIDQFHNDQDPTAIAQYRELPYYRGTKEKGLIRKADILSEGRAEKLGLGRVVIPPNERFYELTFNGFDMEVGDRVYVNAFGDVLASADLSYEKQSRVRCGNILTHPMDRILFNAMYRVPTFWLGERNQKCVFSIRIQAEAGTISESPIDHQSYYETAAQAAAAYHTLRNNLRMTPMNPTERQVPDDLCLLLHELDPEELRCDGCTVKYLVPHQKGMPMVKIEVLRCPFEEAFGDAW